MNGIAGKAALNADPLESILVVDLDGTLIKTDLLVEATLALLKRSPFSFVLLPFWLAGGKANLKEKIAERVVIDAAALPYNQEILDFVSAEHKAGRRIWLATASHQKFAQSVAAHLGVFDRVLATGGSLNLCGEAKLRELAAHLGPNPFDYAGNALVDLPIWSKATRAFVVHPARPVEEAVASLANVERIFPKRTAGLLTFLKAIRLHQWLKNLLIFVPLLLAHRADDLALLINCSIAFLAFGLTASSAYVLNDLLDLTADRLHPRKRYRPFASGDLSPSVGIWLAPALLASGVLLAAMLPTQFAVVLLAYYAGTAVYSLKLKHHAMLDVTALATLYTLRIIAGLIAISAPWSFWLLAFSVFIFLSLALIKRYSELKVMQRAGKQEAAGRGYEVGDFTILSAAGMASGYVAALVLALYVNSPEVRLLYRTPEAIWLLCYLLVYWVSRMWMITHRGDMHDDPILFALSDGPSLTIGALFLAVIFVAAI